MPVIEVKRINILISSLFFVATAGLGVLWILMAVDIKKNMLEIQTSKTGIIKATTMATFLTIKHLLPPYPIEEPPENIACTIIFNIVITIGAPKMYREYCIMILSKKTRVLGV